MGNWSHENPRHTHVKTLPFRNFVGGRLVHTTLVSFNIGPVDMVIITVCAFSKPQDFVKMCLHCPTPIPTPTLDSHSYGVGCYCFLKRSVHWTYTDSYSDADGYCTQFDTDISTNKVILK